MSMPNDELAKMVERIVREVVNAMVEENDPMAIPIGISARHLHICQENSPLMRR